MHSSYVVRFWASKRPGEHQRAISALIAGRVFFVVLLRSYTAGGRYLREEEDAMAITSMPQNRFFLLNHLLKLRLEKHSKIPQSKLGLMDAVIWVQPLALMTTADSIYHRRWRIGATKLDNYLNSLTLSHKQLTLRLFMAYDTSGRLLPEPCPILLAFFSLWKRSSLII